MALQRSVQVPASAQSGKGGSDKVDDWEGEDDDDDDEWDEDDTSQPGQQRLQQGYLTKEPLHGNALSQAKRRFFVLTPDAIEWHERDTVGSVPKGYLLLRGAQVSWRRNAGEKEKLVVASGADKLVLSLGDENQRGELYAWDAAIQDQIGKLPMLKRSAPLHEAADTEVKFIGRTRVVVNRAAPPANFAGTSRLQAQAQMQRLQQQRMATQPRETRGAVPSPAAPKESRWVDFGLASLSVTALGDEQEEAALDGGTKRGKILSRVHGVGLRQGANWQEASFGLDASASIAEEVEEVEEEVAADRYRHAQGDASQMALRMLALQGLVSFEMAGLPQLDDRRRERSEFLAFGLELIDAKLTLDEEAELDLLSQESFAAARSLQESSFIWQLPP